MSDLDLECDLLSPPQVVYKGWLDSWIHGAITEALAAIDPKVEGDCFVQYDIEFTLAKAEFITC